MGAINRYAVGSGMGVSGWSSPSATFRPTPPSKATSLNELSTITKYILLSPPTARMSLDLDSIVSTGSETYFRTQITNIEKQIVSASVRG